MDLKQIELRKHPIEQGKYRILQDGSNVTKAKKELDYKYYVCDYCKEEFKSGKQKWEERKGGILKYSILGGQSIELAVCNKCLKDVLKKLDLVYRK